MVTVSDQDNVVAIRFDLGGYTTDAFLYQQVFQDPRVLEWQHGATTLVLSLDGFDEGALRIPTLGRLLAEWLGSVDRERLYLRIACRTADWPTSLGSRLAQLFSEPTTVELLPFRQSDVARILEAESLDAVSFLRDVKRHGLSALAARPLTLRLLIASFRSEGAISGGGAQVYARGCAALARESNQARRDSDPQMASETLLLESAEQLAACTVFAGSTAFWIGDPASTPAGDLTLDDCFRTNDDRGRRAGALVLHSALFSGAGESRLRWSHATFVDYLAARWVVRMNLTDHDVQALCLTTGSRIFGPVRQLAAWLVSIDPTRFEWLIDGDPASFLTNVDIPSEALRARLVEHMLRDLGAGRTYEDWTWALSGLAHSQLAEQLLPIAQSSQWDLVDFAIRLARACGVVELGDALVALVANPGAPRSIRTSAAMAMRDIGIPASALTLVPILSDGTLDTLEDGAELWAAVARMLWPTVLSTSEVLCLRAPRPRENLLGVYSIFMHELAAALTSSDITAALDWAMVHASIDINTHERVLDTAIVTLCISHLEHPQVRSELSRRAGERSRMFESIFGDDVAIEELAVDVRRELVHVVAADADEDLAYALITQRQGGKGALLGRDDFGWILRQLDGGPEASLAALGAAARYLFDESNFEQVDQVLQLNPGGYGYSLFADRLGAWELQSARAVSAREAWKEAKARRTAHEKKFNQARGAWVDGQIHEALDAYGAGDLSAYWQASRLLTVRPGTDHYFDELQPDLTMHPRWQALSEPSKEKFFQQSLDFLVRGHCDRDSWFGKLHRHYPSEAAYRALTLLLRLAPDEIQTLPDRVWSEWAPIIINWPVATNAADTADKAALISSAAVSARTELENCFLTLVDASIARGDHHHFLRTELMALESRRMSKELFSRIDQFEAMSVAHDVLDYLLGAAPELAQLALERWVQEAAVLERPARAADAALRLLQEFGPAAWPQLAELMKTDTELMRAAFSAPRLAYDLRVPALTEAQLAELWLWLENEFPSSADPQFDDAHFVGPRETVGRFRDNVLERLRTTPTDAAGDAIRSLMTRHPERLILRRALIDVERAAADAVWRPIECEAVLALALDDRRTFVRNERDLWLQTQAALAGIASRLQADTPIAHLLWDTHSRRPKTEDEISDFLLHELRERLAAAGVTVNREVPTRRSSPSGLAMRPDLRIEALAVSAPEGTMPMVLPVEVKGSWHADVLTAANNQLASGYMADLGAKYGVFIAVWFDVDSWDPDDSRRRNGQRFSTPTALHEAVEKAMEVNRGADGVAVRVLDASIRWPTR
ncbi:hypothetical protein [Microbacterium sp. MYb66]|uniref:hypothetical protein n=1 Tax=Microbacterium sp. MYb66 TaxID=1848692 RepID=UPI0011AFF5D5|nr:hypothetical protein [Microbacterium sp. MYb66]